MSSHKVKVIEEAALLIANDLGTGRSVYRTSKNQWTEHVVDALILTDSPSAQRLLEAAQTEVTQVIDPYLVACDASGNVVHIRELIRTQGPTVLPQAEYNNYNADCIDPSSFTTGTN